MSVYCMSDIHGEYDRYIAMLELINFSPEDTLYVLGDVIDRCPKGVDILLDIMNRPNVHMILGNHELMCLNALDPNHTLNDRHLWQQNGGSKTRSDLLYKRTKEERTAVLDFLRSLPDRMDIEVNGRIFHLVHGFPSPDPFERVWNRPGPEAPAPFPDKDVIIGHTATPFLTGKFTEPFRICWRPGIIVIDCGCGNKTPFRRLACLRLDDMQEFYI